MQLEYKSVDERDEKDEKRNGKASLGINILLSQ